MRNPFIFIPFLCKSKQHYSYCKENYEDRRSPIRTEGIIDRIAFGFMGGMADNIPGQIVHDGPETDHEKE